ncbi:hypothetical protein Tco_0469361 [Tanacetum coccineum]
MGALLLLLLSSSSSSSYSGSSYAPNPPLDLDWMYLVTQTAGEAAVGRSSSWRSGFVSGQKLPPLALIPLVGSN